MMVIIKMKKKKIEMFKKDDFTKDEGPSEDIKD